MCCTYGIVCINIFINTSSCAISFILVCDVQMQWTWKYGHSFTWNKSFEYLAISLKTNF